MSSKIMSAKIKKMEDSNVYVELWRTLDVLLQKNGLKFIYPVYSILVKKRASF